MKSFPEFLEESKKRKEKKKEKKPTVEVLPTIADGEKGMTTNVNNEEAKVFKRKKKSAQGSINILHNAGCANEEAPPGKKYERMVKHIKKSYAKDGKLTKDEKSIAYATAWKNKNKNK